MKCTACSGMKCTAWVAMLRNNHAWFTGGLRLSFGWEMVDRSFFSFKPEKAVPDVAQFNLEPGDRIFLCTDGVHKYVDPEILKARLLDDKSPEVILDTIAFLCEKFSDDNYSAILIVAE